MTATCSTCGAPIVWRRGERGGRMPLDAQPNPAGNVLDLGPDEPAIVLREPGLIPLDAPTGGTLRTSHFATCPDAAKHRKRRRQR